MVVGPPLCPVVDVVGVEEVAVLAAGEAAAAVARPQRAAHRGRDRPRLAAVSNNRSIAGQPARGLGRKGAAVVQLAAALAVVREHLLVDVDDDLVALAGRTALAGMGDCGVGDRDQRLRARRLPRGPRFRGTALCPQDRSRSASRARRKSAPSSGARRPWIASDPSGSQNTSRYAASWRSRDSSDVTRRYARTARSSCAAVKTRASSSSSSSFSAVATRVRARAFAYDSSPWAKASWISGSSGSRRATRTCSRAARGVSAQRQASHSAHEPRPSSAQRPRRSISATSSSQRQVPAYRCDASVASSASSSSRSRVAEVGPLFCLHIRQEC